MPGSPIILGRTAARRKKKQKSTFGFVEFRSVEETNNGLNLNGIILGGKALNVGRPGSYLGPTVSAVAWPQLAAAMLQVHAAPRRAWGLRLSPPTPACKTVASG